MTHYLRFDTRIGVLRSIISPFQNQLNEIKKICVAENNIYWDSIYADDIEHLVGTVFIILQNYINSSISDLFPDLSKLYSKYSFDKKINNSQTTRIELIIAVANYYKHRDLPTKLEKYTEKPFIDLKIKFIEENFGPPTKITGACSPVFNGFGMLSESWDFNDLISIVSEWRENMWLKEEVDNFNLNRAIP